MKQKHRHYGYLVLFLLILFWSFGAYFFPPWKQLASPLFIREYLLGWGLFSYPLFILFIASSIILPVPSTLLILGGGYLYGTILGSVLALIAVVLGSSLAFFLVRAYGKPLINKLVDRHHLFHFNHVFTKRGKVAVFISYAIPVFPSDVVSLLLGLTTINYRTFLVLVILGHIPRLFIINSLGADLFAGFTLKTVIILSLAILLAVITIFREKFKKIIFREIKDLKNEANDIRKNLLL